MALAGFLAYAAAAKLILGGWQGTADTIVAAWAGTPLLHYALIAAELVLAGWLVIGTCPRSSAAVALLLLSAFSGLIVREMRKDHPKPCGCAGAVVDADDPAAVRRSLMFSLGRNGLMMAGAAWLFLAAGTAPKDIEPRVAEAPEGTGNALA
jgi:hypothetical protein